MSSFQDNTIFIFECPHCYENISFNKFELINNVIFKHGIFKSTGKWMNPFMSNILCERYINNKKILGCGKNFKIIYDNYQYKVIKI